MCDTGLDLERGLAGSYRTESSRIGGQAERQGHPNLVELVLDMIAAGVGEREILGNYPQLGLESIRACAAYASAILKARSSRSVLE